MRDHHTIERTTATSAATLKNSRKPNNLQAPNMEDHQLCSSHPRSRTSRVQRDDLLTRRLWSRNLIRCKGARFCVPREPLVWILNKRRMEVQDEEENKLCGRSRKMLKRREGTRLLLLSLCPRQLASSAIPRLYSPKAQRQGLPRYQSKHPNDAIANLNAKTVQSIRSPVISQK